MNSHCGYVTSLKNVRKHPNADKLLLAECFGNTVCVSLDYHEGQVGVYFPTDLQLSPEFCKANDLVRRKDENGNACGGYLDPEKRNIKAMKLRGEKSDGLFLPLTCLANFTTISNLKIGDTIDILNGVEICRKYIPRSNHSNVGGFHGGVKKVKANFAPTFYEHVDTAQLAYNLNAFKPGDVVELTLKMHGCFTSEMKVRMFDGALKKIKDIVVGDQVLGYNFESNRFESAKVLNCFHNDKSSNWRKIKFSREGLLGNKRSYINCTYNHPFWWKEQNNWIEAKDLIPGMKISTLASSYIFSERQKEVLVGMVLGDGYYSTYHNNHSAEIQNSSKDKEYLNYLASILGDCYKVENKEYKSGYGSIVYRGRTCRSADLSNYCRNLFVNDNGNKLTDDIVKVFTPISAAILYMDDGSLAHGGAQSDRALIAICDYNEHDAKIIQECFRKFNIGSVYYVDNRGYSRLRFNKDDAEKLFALISPYIPDCMRYKLPKNYPNNFIQLEALNGYNGYVFTEQEVLENVVDNSTHYEYDLETSLHNYVVGNALVHNTSGRTGYLPLITHHQTFWDKIFHRLGHEVKEYGYVTGTRRVVLDDKHTGGFYDDNTFRIAMAKKFENKLRKGEVVYYEIVGFINASTPIMASVKNSKIPDKAFIKKYGEETIFSYGCDPNGDFERLPKITGRFEDGTPIYSSTSFHEPCCDIYVYRMTQVNEDGDVVELSPEQMRLRCEQMSVKTVPVFETFMIPNDANINPGEYVLRKVEQYFDGPDPIGKTHIREGVVARIVNRPEIAVYKHKNHTFKMLSGIIAESVADGEIAINDSVIEEL